MTRLIIVEQVIMALASSPEPSQLQPVQVKDSVISARQLTKKFEDETTVEDVSFEVPHPKALTNPFRKISACPSKKGLFRAKDLKWKIRGYILFHRDVFKRMMCARDFDIDSGCIIVISRMERKITTQYE